MGNLSEYFSQHEFSCRHCNSGRPAPALLDLLEIRRRDLGSPIIINSGGRCVVHNEEVGGSPSSEHIILGWYHRAADYRHDQLQPLEECQWLEQNTDHAGGLGAYYKIVDGEILPSFIHIDVGRSWRVNHPHLPRRWIYIDGTYLWLGVDFEGGRFCEVSHSDLAQVLKRKGLLK